MTIIGSANCLANLNAPTIAAVLGEDKIKTYSTAAVSFPFRIRLLGEQDDGKDQVKYDRTDRTAESTAEDSVIAFDRKRDHQHRHQEMEKSRRDFNTFSDNNDDQSFQALKPSETLEIRGWSSYPSANSYSRSYPNRVPLIENESSPDRLLKSGQVRQNKKRSLSVPALVLSVLFLVSILRKQSAEGSI